MADLAYKENYYVLLAAILCKEYLTPEEAFRTYYSNSKKYTKYIINEKDIIDMINMRKTGMTNKEIGTLYNMKSGTVSKRIHRYLTKLEAA